MSQYCPRCAIEVDGLALQCNRCGADFSHPEGWRPVSAPGSWKPTPTGVGAVIQVTTRALALLFLFPIVVLCALVFSYFGGGEWLVIPFLLAVAALGWVLAPAFAVAVRGAGRKSSDRSV
jgi:hypothetical protein